VGVLESNLTYYQQEVDRLEEIIAMLRNARFGAKSEKSAELGSPQMVLPLFDEAEATVAATPEIEEPETVTVTRKVRKRGGRRKLPEDLPHETIVHDLPDEEKVCVECHQPMQQIGVDSSEQLEYKPATLKVIVHERPKYGCKCCECAPKQAKAAPRAIPKSIATPSLLTHILISKFLDATPLYRQESQWKRIGIDLGRAVMSHWVLKCGTLLLLLWELMRQDLIVSGVVHADETPVQVLKEKGRTAAQKSYMWLFQCGPPGKRIILYHYAPTRAGSVPGDILGELFQGSLQTDGYSGYHAICARDGVIGVACMTHIRRKFAEVAKLNKNKRGLAREAVAIIARLYAVEREAKDQELDYDQRKALRLRKAKPIMDEFKQWLDANQQKVPPKMALGKAFTYAQNEWSRMMHYLDDGRIEIDNNPAEQSVKPFVIGRKNWLFCNTANGAKASAVVYSLLQSAKANDLPTYKWLTFVLNELPRCTTDEERKSLLPHRFDVSRLEKQ
jgi:transposase